MLLYSTSSINLLFYTYRPSADLVCPQLLHNICNCQCSSFTISATVSAAVYYNCIVCLLLLSHPRLCQPNLGCRTYLNSCCTALSMLLLDLTAV